MDVADRHVLDVVPVGLQVWETVGDSLTLRYANEVAQREALPDDAPWLRTMRAVCAAQEAATFELEAPGQRWWRAQITPLGAGSILTSYCIITPQKLQERSLRPPAPMNPQIL